MSPPPPTVPSNTEPSRPPLSPASLQRRLNEFRAHPSALPPNVVRFLGPRPSPHPISLEVREMLDQQSIRRPVSTLNDPFFSILERAERRGADRSPDRLHDRHNRDVDRFSGRFGRDREGRTDGGMERRRSPDRFDRSRGGFFDRSDFFSRERVERRRDEKLVDEKIATLMKGIRDAKKEKEEKAVDGVIIDESLPSPDEGIVAIQMEKNVVPEGKICEKGVRTTRTSTKASKRLGPDGTIQMKFAREKTIEENGKVITHEKEEHAFIQ